MAHHKSAKKRIRQNIKQNIRNRALRADLRTTIKGFQVTLEAGDADKVKSSLTLVQKTLDKAVTKGILHASTASRKKSRLASAANKKLASAAS